MITQTFTIARNTFVESVRQPVVFVLLLAAGAIQIFNNASTAFAMGMTETSEVSSDDKLLLDIGLSAVFGLGTLLAAFVATAVMSREVEQKTILTVVSKPVGRPWIVLGKYLGVAGTILVATLTMLLFLLLGIRHGVLSTAADDIDWPVLVFGGSAVAGALILAAWCNYFYGWSFPQLVVTLLLPFTFLAYIGVLFVSDKWEFQEISHDFKPQITIASSLLIVAVLVFTAIATAASVRLGQVMTIVVCAGIFLASLLSNYFLGQHAFVNTLVAQIDQAKIVAPPTAEQGSTPGPDQIWEVRLREPPLVPLQPGMPFYYGGSPSGFPMKTPEFAPYEGPIESGGILNAPRPAMVITAVDGRNLTFRYAGQAPMVGLAGPPQSGDYLFVTPTKTRPHFLIAWAVMPNMQHFWLLDAVSQNQLIPPRHVVLVAFYGVAQVGVFLSLAVILFQRRDVG
ncbi:MAG: ABC transporter permease [Planctomycetota bacterium]|nr:ABC transporter permease [Planctomycetota bacterium]